MTPTEQKFLYSGGIGLLILIVWNWKDIISIGKKSGDVPNVIVEKRPPPVAQEFDIPDINNYYSNSGGSVGGGMFPTVAAWNPPAAIGAYGQTRCDACAGETKTQEPVPPPPKYVSPLESIIDSTYMTLFGRHVEAGGLKYWSDAINVAGAPVSALYSHIAKGAQGSDRDAMFARFGNNYYSSPI